MTPILMKRSPDELIREWRTAKIERRKQQLYQSLTVGEIADFAEHVKQACAYFQELGEFVDFLEEKRVSGE